MTSKVAAETIRLEEYTGVLQDKMVVVWSAAASSWLPSEFMLAQYITRILVTGRGSPASMELAADSGWTQVWRSPGGKEWSCLLGVLQHMPGPVLLVIGPDMGLTPKIVTSLREAAVTVIALRQVGAAPWPPSSSEAPHHVFFPVLDARAAAALAPVLQEWSAVALPKSLDIRSLIPQLTAQGYGLTVAAGVWHWYKPADSTGLTTLTVPQIARQIQLLGAMLERQGTAM
jgi:hypothetical protein